MLKLGNERKKITFACFLVYIIVNAILVICNYDAYAIDEFYSLGSANLDITTTYQYAPYINATIRVISSLFGSNYYLFKLLPMSMGFVSYCCAMYLVDKISHKTSTVVIVSLAITFNAILLCSHMYIRHYVFAEAAYMLSMVFLYKYASEGSNKILKYIYLVLFALPNCLYNHYTADSSGEVLWYLTIAMFVIIALQRYWNKILYSKLFWGITVIVLGIVEFFTILMKKQMIDYTSNSRLEKIYTVISFYQTDSFVYIQFLAFAYLAVVISIVAVIVKQFKSGFKDKGIVFLTVYTTIPIMAYIMFMFNNNMLRCYVSYMIAGYIILAYFLDSIEKKSYKIVLAVVLVVNTIFSYYPFPKGLIEFWSEPMLCKEIYYIDYKEWLEEGRAAADNGYTIVPMMTLLGEEYYFDFDTTESLTMLDEQNQRIRTDDEIVSEFERLMDSGDKYVVMIDTLGRDALIRVGLYDTMKEKYSYTLYYDKWYDDGISIFYIE
jgi:hypothetical protein